MNNIVPFKNLDSLPAHIQARLGNADNSALGQAVAGFPVLSLKGKRFTLVRSGEREIINDPRTDEPANHITVAILRANPGMSKAYYAEGYVEGADGKPDCFSNDGKTPDTNATNPQARSCHSCPHNVFGSSTTGKGKACPDTKRLAVAQIDNLDDPILLRVPPTSLKNLANFGAQFTSKGIKFNYIATKIGFDPQATHQLLTFQGVGFLDDATIERVEALQSDETVLRITGEAAIPQEAPVAKPKPKLAAVQVDEDDEEEVAPPPKPKAKAKPAPVVEEEDDEDETVVSAKDFLAKPKAKVRVDVEDAPAPKPKAKVKVDTDDDLADGIGDFLAGGFDDD